MVTVGKGDLSAFNEIIHRHQDTAWRVAYRFLGDSAEAEDIAQEAFLRETRKQGDRRIILPLFTPFLECASPFPRPAEQWQLNAGPDQTTDIGVKGTLRKTTQ